MLTWPAARPVGRRSTTRPPPRTSRAGPIRASTPSPYGMSRPWRRWSAGWRGAPRLPERARARQREPVALGPPRVERRPGHARRQYRVIEGTRPRWPGRRVSRIRRDARRPVAIKVLYADRVDGDSRRKLARGSPSRCAAAARSRRRGVRGRGNGRRRAVHRDGVYSRHQLGGAPAQGDTTVAAASGRAGRPGRRRARGGPCSRV